MIKQLITLEALNQGKCFLTKPIYYKIPIWNRQLIIDFTIRITDRWLIVIIGILTTIIALQWWALPKSSTQVDNVVVQIPHHQTQNPLTAAPVSASMPSTAPIKDVISYIMTQLEESQSDFSDNGSFRDKFLVQKQLLLTKYLISSKASRLDQLPDNQLLMLNKEISNLFVELVLNNTQAQPHVYRYFTDTTDLNKLETALMEQAKFHVPASIKLAQSALETAYGQRIVDNNYFGIKDKEGLSKLTTTIEYYTPLEKKANENIILSAERITKNGKTLYKCIVKDHFASYQTPWQSFRAHSIFLNTNRRYSPLFTKGKNYEDWADKIGSTKYGGVGYATSPIYGEILKKIIERYHLDLLDF